MPNRASIALLALPLILVAVPFACSKDETPPETPGPTGGLDPDIGKTFSASVGPEGGTLTGTSNGIEVMVPARRLASATTLTLSVKDPSALPQPADSLSAAYELGPDGQTFMDEVTLSIRVTKPVPAGEMPVIKVLDPKTNTWTVLDGSRTVYDGRGGTRVIARSGHFSTYTTGHAPYVLPDEKCRAPLNGGVLGVFTADTLNVSGATVTKRQQSKGDLKIEYSSEWIANSPSVTVSGLGVIDGKGEWRYWREFGYTRDASGNTAVKPPTTEQGFVVSGGKFSFNVDVKSVEPLGAPGYGVIHIDDPCLGAVDVSIQCGPGCSGPIGDGGADGSSDASADGATDTGTTETGGACTPSLGNITGHGGAQSVVVSGPKLVSATGPTVVSTALDGTGPLTIITATTGESFREVNTSGGIVVASPNGGTARIGRAPADGSAAASFFDLATYTAYQTALALGPVAYVPIAGHVVTDGTTILLEERTYGGLIALNASSMIPVGFLLGPSTDRSLTGVTAMVLQGNQLVTVIDRSGLGLTPLSAVRVFDVSTKSAMTIAGQVLRTDGRSAALIWDGARGRYLYSTSTSPTTPGIWAFTVASSGVPTAPTSVFSITGKRQLRSLAVAGNAVVVATPDFTVTPVSTQVTILGAGSGGGLTIQGTLALPRVDMYGNSLGASTDGVFVAPESTADIQRVSLTGCL